VFLFRVRDNGFEKITGKGSRDGMVVRALASHQCGPGSTPGHGVMGVEFVVDSRPCSERFFSGYSGFPLCSKTNNSKFQFDPEPEGHRFVSPRLFGATLVKQS